MNRQQTYKGSSIICWMNERYIFSPEYDVNAFYVNVKEIYYIIKKSLNVVSSVSLISYHSIILLSQ